MEYEKILESKPTLELYTRMSSSLNETNSLLAKMTDDIDFTSKAYQEKFDSLKYKVEASNLSEDERDKILGKMTEILTKQHELSVPYTNVSTASFFMKKLTEITDPKLASINYKYISENFGLVMKYLFEVIGDGLDKPYSLPVLEVQNKVVNTYSKFVQFYSHIIKQTYLISNK